MIEQMSNPHFLACRSETRLTRFHPRALEIQNDGIRKLGNDARNGGVEVKFSRFYELESCDLLEGRKRVSLGTTEQGLVEYVQ